MATPAQSGVPKLLLIDSNVFFAKRLAESLKKEGFEVMHATQSAYALTMIEWNPPLAILCATNMREMGAFELPPILHADIKTAHIPIIAVGDGGDQALMEAFRAGCEDYVDRRSGPDAQADRHSGGQGGEGHVRPVGGAIRTVIDQTEVVGRGGRESG